DAHTAAYKLSGGRIGGKAYGVPGVLLESGGRESGQSPPPPASLLAGWRQPGPDRFQGRDRPTPGLVPQPEGRPRDDRVVGGREAPGPGSGSERRRARPALADDGRGLSGLRE